MKLTLLQALLKVAKLRKRIGKSSEIQIMFKWINEVVTFSNCRNSARAPRIILGTGAFYVHFNHGNLAPVLVYVGLLWLYL